MFHTLVGCEECAGRRECGDDDAADTLVKPSKQGAAVYGLSRFISVQFCKGWRLKACFDGVKRVDNEADGKCCDSAGLGVIDEQSMNGMGRMRA